MDAILSMPVIAVVTEIKGEVFAKAPDGSMRRLKSGDSLHEGEVVVTSAGGSAEVTNLDGQAMAIGEQQTVTLDSEVAGTAKPDAADASVSLGQTDAERVIQALTTGVDINEILEETAAGLTGGGEGEGHSFVRLLRVSEDVTPLQYAFGDNQATIPEAVVPGDIGEGRRDQCRRARTDD